MYRSPIESKENEIKTIVHVHINLFPLITTDSACVAHSFSFDS